MVAHLAEKMNVEFFILGHVHSPAGYARVSSRAISLACDHQHGCILRFSTDQPLTDALAQAAITPVVALAVPQAADRAGHGRDDS